ncbi:MAG: hypothetical protein HYR73_07440 [Candidatus Eisenbacteria bacterium]|nr:hypothetical protein [Candidatus Eisenbacteria bacterium]
MRRLAFVIPAIAILVLAGCGKKTEQAANTGSDSLLATNPVEQPQGNLTPQTQYQGGNGAAQPSPAPAPQSEKKPGHTTTSQPTHHPAEASAPAPNPGVTLPAGTGIKIKVGAKITSETANPGDAWSGVVEEPVVIGTAAPIPAGSTVSGIVEAAKPAKKGDRAMLLLAIQSVTVNGKSHSVEAVTDSMVAGSTRARNTGAVAGGAAAGALIGSAIGGGKGALIGGLLGGGAAAGGVAASKGYQVTVDEGSTLTFHVSHDVTIHN